MAAPVGAASAASSSQPITQDGTDGVGRSTPFDQILFNDTQKRDAGMTQSHAREAICDVGKRISDARR
jgi:hypothetical protein